MAFAVNKNSFRTAPTLALAPIQRITPSDTVPCLINGYYPRGFRVLTGGTLTLWTFDGDLSAKIDLGTVDAGFEWTYGAFAGIAATNVAGSATTAADIIALP